MIGGGVPGAQRANYVWYSAEERALGGWSPAGASFLRPVFESAGVTLYQVVLPEGGAP
jgi:hypothetical protein